MSKLLQDIPGGSRRAAANGGPAPNFEPEIITMNAGTKIGPDLLLRAAQLAGIHDNENLPRMARHQGGSCRAPNSAQVGLRAIQQMDQDTSPLAIPASTTPIDSAINLSGGRGTPVSSRMSTVAVSVSGVSNPSINSPHATLIAKWRRTEKMPPRCRKQDAPSGLPWRDHQIGQGLGRMLRARQSATNSSSVPDADKPRASPGVPNSIDQAARASDSNQAEIAVHRRLRRSTERLPGPHRSRAAKSRSQSTMRTRLRRAPVRTACRSDCGRSAARSRSARRRRSQQALEHLHITWQEGDAVFSMEYQALRRRRALMTATPDHGPQPSLPGR